MVSSEFCDELVQEALEDGIQKLVVGGFIINEGKLLIVRRSETDPFMPNLEEVPSGGVDQGESLLIALHREVEEETGLKNLEVIGYANHFDYQSKSGRKTRQFNFLMRSPDAKVVLNPQEHSEYIFTDLNGPSFANLNLSQQTRSCILLVKDRIVAGRPGLKLTSTDTSVYPDGRPT